MQDEDDLDDEAGSKDALELIQLTRRHIEQVTRLEGLREVEVEVRKWLCATDITIACRCLGWMGHLCGSGVGRERAQGSSPSQVVWLHVVGDEVVVCDRENHRVQVFGRNGVSVRQWGNLGDGPGQFQRPFGLAAKGTEVIVADENHRVQVIGLDGTFVRQWGGERSRPGQFNVSVGVAVVEGKVLNVCDAGNERVQVFN